MKSAGSISRWPYPSTPTTERILRLFRPSPLPYIDSFSVTFRICTPCTSDAPPRIAQATWTASVISSVFDPFSRQAMVYRPQGTNWLIYSVGVDAVDDGGIPAKKLVVGAKGDLFFDAP